MTTFISLPSNRMATSQRARRNLRDRPYHAPLPRASRRTIRASPAWSSAAPLPFQSPRAHVVAAWLPLKSAGAVVSHESALEMYGLADVIPSAVHVSIPRTKRGVLAKWA